MTSAGGLAETLSALHSASFARGWSAQEFDALLANPRTHAVTTPHGFALVQIIPPEAELITLAVRPALRGQGHGTALLRNAINTARDNGADTMILEVEATNAAAIALYHSAGFTETGRRAGYYAHPDKPAGDAILMTCALQSST